MRRGRRCRLAAVQSRGGLAVEPRKYAYGAIVVGNIIGKRVACGAGLAWSRQSRNQGVA